MRLGLRLFIIFRAPFRYARVRFSLAICRGLARFLELFGGPDQIFFARAIRCHRRLFYINFVCQLSDSHVLQVQVFGRVRSILAVLAVRNVTHLRVFRFCYATGVSHARFICFFAINAYACVGLHRAFFQASIYITRVVTFVRRAARCFGMLCVSSVEFRDYLGRMG